MKIVFQNVAEWEKKPHAEAELALRMVKAAQSIGSLDAIASSDMDEIASFNPDVVVPLHFYIPKLFDAFTVGCMWNPVKSIDRNNAWDSIKSYDGYGVASDYQRQVVKALKFRSPSPYFLSTLYPSTNTTNFRRPEIFSKPVYIGSNWCKDRHTEVFTIAKNISVFGPRDSWHELDGSIYKGEVPFDGISLLRTYHEAGIGLALHHGYHNHEGLPSMRPFEIAASGAVMISDQNEFIHEAFGDNALYIDTSLEAEEVVEQIEVHTNWLKGHPQQAQELAKACHDIFVKKYSLEIILQNMISDIESYRSTEILSIAKEVPVVEIIVRTDGVDRKKLFRALLSIKQQTYQEVTALIVYRGLSEELLPLKNAIKEEFTDLKVKYVCENNELDRCTQFYTGLRSSKAPFVGFLDHDDVLFSDHVAVLVDCLSKSPDASLAYSGSVRVWEGEDENVIKEEQRRKLAFFFDLDKSKGLTNGITSNSFIARRKNIPWQLLNQPIPRMDSYEDYALLFSLYDNSANYIFSGKVTCAFYWRTSKDDNTAFVPQNRELNKKLSRLINHKSGIKMYYEVKGSGIASNESSLVTYQFIKKILLILKNDTVSLLNKLSGKAH